MTAYFLAVTICWAACLAFYAGLLRREKFFHLNRAYLMATLALGLLIPLIEWPAGSSPGAAEWFNSMVLAPVVTISAEPQAMTGEASFLAPVRIAWLILLAGSAGMALRFLGQLFRLATVMRRGQLSRQSGYALVESREVTTPFSFFSLLFWNPELEQDPDAANTIRSHELAHIRQGHSLDIVFLELAGIFFWWNPLWHIYGRTIRNVHEYLADEAAIRETTAREYGQLLIRQCLSQAAPALSHGLKNHSQLKNRIAMMTKSRSSKLAVAKYAAVLPLLVFLVFACAQTEKDEALQPVETLSADQPVFTEVEKMPVFGPCANLEGQALTDCSFNNLVNYIGGQLKYPEDARTNGIDGMVVASFVVYADGHVGDVEILKSLTASCDAEVERLIMAMPAWQPGEKEGKPVNVEFKLPVKFKLEADKE